MADRSNIFIILITKRLFKYSTAIILDYTMVHTGDEAFRFSTAIRRISFVIIKYLILYVIPHLCKTSFDKK